MFIKSQYKTKLIIKTPNSNIINIFIITLINKGKERAYLIE